MSGHQVRGPLGDPEEEVPGEVSQTGIRGGARTEIMGSGP